MTEPRTIIACARCGGFNVTCDAVARWDNVTQQWEMSSMFDNTDCDDCSGECRTVERTYTPTVYIYRADAEGNHDDTGTHWAVYLRRDFAGVDGGEDWFDIDDDSDVVFADRDAAGDYATRLADDYACAIDEY